jgi:hypothetical protein
MLRQRDLGKPGIVEPESNKGNDPTRSSYDRAYWLRRCEGCLVETPTKRIGRVTGIRYGETTNEPEIYRTQSWSKSVPSCGLNW